MFLSPWGLPEIVWFHRIQIWNSKLEKFWIWQFLVDEIYSIIVGKLFFRGKLAVKHVLTDFFELIKAPWNLQTLPDWTVILKELKNRDFDHISSRFCHFLCSETRTCMNGSDLGGLSTDEKSSMRAHWNRQVQIFLSMWFSSFSDRFEAEILAWKLPTL